NRPTVPTYRKRKTLRWTNHRSVFENLFDFALADAGAHKPPVVLHANTTTGEKISHGCDGLFRVLRAGADRKDKVTEREFRTGFEDLFSLFHNRTRRFRAYMVPFRSIMPL